MSYDVPGTQHSIDMTMNVFVCLFLIFWLFLIAYFDFLYLEGSEGTLLRITMISLICRDIYALRYDYFKTFIK